MSARPEKLLRHLCRSLPEPIADDALLEHFARQRDEQAFATLVERHGPMVLAVCRRVLGNIPEAEDAFQATFLVLARKADSIRPPGALAAFLHSVARRVALKARTAERQRRARQTADLSLDMPGRGADPLDQLTARELLLLLDEGIQRLPDCYRLPLLLCCLQGRTQEETAQLLGWTPGSVKGRLERGRARLHDWLSRRGLSLGVVLQAAEVSPIGAGAGVPAGLASATVPAALPFAVGAEAGLSARVVALAEAGLPGTSLARVKGAVVLMLAVGLIAGASAVAQLPAKKQPGAQVALRDSEEPKRPARKLPPRDQNPDALPNGAVARLGTARFRHDGEAHALAYSPDGELLAGRAAGAVILWNARTGGERTRLPMRLGFHPAHFWRMAFSPDSRLLATPSAADRIDLWDVRTTKVTRKLPLPGAVEGDVGVIRFSPDGKLLAVGGANNAYLLDLPTGKVLHRFGRGACGSVLAFSPDGKTLTLSVWKGDQTQVHDLHVHSVRTAALLRCLHGHNTLVGDIAFTGDGKLMASGSKEKVVLWDAATGKVVRRIDVKTHDLCDLAFTPDGKTLVAGVGDGWVEAWDVGTGRSLRRLDPRMFLVRSMALSPDGKTVAAGCVYSAIRLWDLGTGRELFTDQQGHDAQINSVAFSPDGKWLVSAGDNRQLWTWEAKTGKPLRRFAGTSARLVRFSPDGRRLALLSPDTSFPGRFVHVWDAVTGKELFRLPPGDVREVSAVEFSPDGKTLITASWTVKERKEREVICTIRVWDAFTGRSLRSFPLVGLHPYCLAVGPDGKTVAVGGASEGGLVRLCDLDRGEETLALLRPPRQPHVVTSLAFSSDGRTLLTGDTWSSGTPSPPTCVRLWELATAQDIYRLDRLGRSVAAVNFSPDGRLVAAGGGDLLHLWDVCSGKEVRSYQGHRSSVTSLAFSPDGSRLASGLHNSTVLLWDVPRATTKGAGLGQDRLAVLWADLAEGDAGKAHRAGWLLAGAARDSVPFLARRLQPAPPLDIKRWRKLLGDLDSDDFGVRTAADRELERLVGRLDPTLLRDALTTNPSLEVRLRLKRLLGRATLLAAGEPLRGVRAIAVLERIGSPAARQILRRLAGGELKARVTGEAKASLDRLARR
jgi:RNA polymerase sigma factor (sigma-70 family)